MRQFDEFSSEFIVIFSTADSYHGPKRGQYTVHTPLQSGCFSGRARPKCHQEFSSLRSAVLL